MGPVLIVEDDPTIRSLVQQTLDDEGYDTVTTANGVDALQLVETTHPACVVLDLNLPILDGYGFLHALDERRKRVPVLLMTADPRGQRLGPADGVLGHIPKPFDLDHLSTAVAMVTQVPPPNRPALGSDSIVAGA